MSDTSAAPRTLLRVYDGGIAGGAVAVDLAHVLTLRWMVSLLPMVEPFSPAIVESALRLFEGVLAGGVETAELRAVASYVARAQASHDNTVPERDALYCVLLAVKVSLVLVGDRLERPAEIREEFARALAGCGVQAIVPMTSDEHEETRA